MTKLFYKRHWIIDYFAIVVGSAIMAIGIGVFLVDAKVVPGGVSGLAMAIHYLSGNFSNKLVRKYKKQNN